MRKIFILLFVSALISSCSSLKITHNLDSTIDFSKFKTYSYYGWDSTNSQINTYYRKEIEFAFVDEFSARGMKYDPSGQGDVVVSIFLIIDVENGVRSYNNYYGNSPYGFYQPAWGYGYGYGGYGAPYAYGGVVYEEYSYSNGTLVCDVFAREEKKLAWQGVANKSIETGNKTRTIPLVIGKLMESFPIKKLDTK